MPFQFSSSILRWLRFFAGFCLIVGLALAVWTAIFQSTRMVEKVEAVRGGMTRPGSPVAAETVEKVEVRVLNPSGIILTFVAVVGAVLSALILMALYWILQNVTAIHYNVTSRGKPPEEPT